jgi:hypothetical protein
VQLPQVFVEIHPAAGGWHHLSVRCLSAMGPGVRISAQPASFSDGSISDGSMRTMDRAIPKATVAHTASTHQ